MLPQPPAPLPPNTFTQGALSHEAYKQCLTLERLDGWNQLADVLSKPFSESIMKEMSPKTVSGLPLRLAPEPADCDVLARDIMDCKSRICSPELLASLAHLYAFGLIRIFRNSKGPTSYVSVDQSPRRSFEQPVNDGNHLLRGTLVTTPTLQKRFNWASTAAAVLERVGGFSAHAILGDDNLNSAANAFTAAYTPHAMFDMLYLWLVPFTDDHGSTIPDTYKVHSLDPDMIPQLKQRISFRQVIIDDTVIPPPSPQLLGLHAACAQVAHLSGAAEYLSDIFGDLYTDYMVSASVMTQPEATTILTQKLKPLTVVPYQPQ